MYGQEKNGLQDSGLTFLATRKWLPTSVPKQANKRSYVLNEYQKSKRFEIREGFLHGCCKSWSMRLLFFKLE
jgi:hypothetical protein